MLADKSGLRKREDLKPIKKIKTERLSDDDLSKLWNATRQQFKKQ